MKGDLELCQLVLLNDRASKLPKASGDPIHHLSTPKITDFEEKLMKYNAIFKSRHNVKKKSEYEDYRVFKCHLVLLHNAFNQRSTLLHLPE